jgi:exopolyphosphatase/guanosine-5'-triphosphate,3'-diphosphate pyrophosphatase
MITSVSVMKELELNGRVAAIDIGSNALRMQIFERDNGVIHVVSTHRIPVRLGRDVFHNGKILSESFDSALKAMQEFRRIIDEHGITNISAVATSAVREASNGSAFIERVLTETGIKVQIIGGAEEARLVITAVLEKMNLKELSALHIEVGGGSVEVSYIENAKIKFSLTHELGAVRLMQVLNSFESETKFREVVKEYIAITHKRLKSIGKKKVDKFIATGGNIDSIIWLLEQTGWREVWRENGVAKITLEALLEVIKRLSVISYRERVEQLHIRPDRADVILPASLVYASFAEMAKAEWIYAPGVGVRDGLAIELFRGGEDAHREEKHSQLISAADALGEKYEFDRAHAHIVASYCLELFDVLQKLHGLGERERVLLEIAAILHDVGYFINISRHHKHSYYIIAESDIAGLSPRDLMIIANIARYHRKAFPKEQHENFSVLPDKEKEVILKLAAILRIADALDHEHLGERLPIKISLEKNVLRIELPQDKDNSLIRWSLASKGGLFTEVFGYDVQVR